MKIKLLCVAILLCAVIGTSALMPVVAQPKADEKQTVVEEVEVDAVKTARFINMLNHNYVYGIDFLTVDDMLSESIVGLLDARDSENPDFIKESYIKDFMYSMYGVEIVDMSNFQSDMPKLEGYVYIMPRGFSEYSHSLVSARENEDGTYTVTTDVAVSAHDGIGRICKAVTLFVENTDSQYGYNIVSSELIENGSEV